MIDIKNLLPGLVLLAAAGGFTSCSGNDGNDDTAYGGPQCTVEKIGDESPTGYGRVMGLSENNIYCLGAGLRHYNGEVWSLVNTGEPPISLSDVWGTSDDDLFIVGSTVDGQTKSLIRHYDGQTWTDMEHPDSYEEIITIWGASPNDVFAIAESLGGNAVLHYDGQAWTEMHTGISSFEKIWGTSGSDVYALSKDAGDGNLERMYHYNGEIWSELTPPSSAGIGYVEDVWGTGPNNLYFVGGTGDGLGGSFPVIVHYDGSNWTPTVFDFWYDEETDDPPNCGFGAVWGYGDDSIFAFGCKDYYFDGIQWWDMTDYLYEQGMHLGGEIWGTSLQNNYVVGGFVYRLNCQ